MILVNIISLILLIFRAQSPITYAQPMAFSKQREVRRAYYAAIAHVDDQIGRVLREMAIAQGEEWAGGGLLGSTVVCVMADHGQNLGEHNMWSMMNAKETSLRVPLIIRSPYTPQDTAMASDDASVFSGPVELIDVYPTLASLAGVPVVPRDTASSVSDAPLDGRDLSSLFQSPSDRNKRGIEQRESDGSGMAFGQITRCHNCSEAYAWSENPKECEWMPRRTRRRSSQSHAAPQKRHGISLH
jgi:arylsulfatase A-like enzyme